MSAHNLGMHVYKLLPYMSTHLPNLQKGKVEGACPQGKEWSRLSDLPSLCSLISSRVVDNLACIPGVKRLKDDDEERSLLQTVNCCVYKCFERQGVTTIK